MSSVDSQDQEAVIKHLKEGGVELVNGEAHVGSTNGFVNGKEARDEDDESEVNGAFGALDAAINGVPAAGATPDEDYESTSELTPVAAPEPTPVAAPEPTSVATPEPTPVATPEPTPVAAPEPTPVATPEPTPVAAPEPTPVAAPEPTPVAAPEPTPVAAPEPTPVAAPEPTPVAAPEPTPVAVPESTPVAAPEPTPVATPAVTREQSQGATYAPNRVSVPASVPASGRADLSWLIKRHSSQELKREVEFQSRPVISKASMSTSIDEKSVRAAYEDVRSDTTDTEWAVFKFQDQKITRFKTGVDFNSFRSCFADDDRAFGFVRIQMGDEMSKRQKFVFLTWVGPEVSVIRRAKMSIDKAMVKNIVKNFAVELQVESLSEISADYFREQLARAGGANYGTGIRE